MPPETVRALEGEGAEIVPMAKQTSFNEGMFWRLGAVDDPEVDFFLIRDADSIVNIREQAAVAEWLESGKHFHIMRDYFSHAALIFGGMWGGVGGVIRDWRALAKPYFCETFRTASYDQKFLRREIWPLIKGSVMIHDSWFRNFGARPFPEGAELPEGRHLGDKDFMFGEEDAE